MSIDPKVGGWTSIRNKLSAVIRIANKVNNARVTRGGTVDSITFAGDSMIINIQDFPESKQVAEAIALADSVSFPFQLVRIDDTTVAVRKGTVNNVIPTIGGTPLDDDYTQNTFTVGGATTFWLDATLNASSVITSVAIVTADPGSDTETQAKQTLGSLTWDSGAIGVVNSNLGGSQNVDSCSAIHSWNRI